MGHRILLVTDAYPPMIGGADRAVRLLGYELRDRGHSPAVLTAAQPRLPAHEDDAGVPVHRVPDLTSRLPFISQDPYRHVPPPWPDPEAVWRIRRLLRRLRPDLVHSYGWLTYSVRAALLGTGIPLVVSTRDYAHVCPIRTLVRHGENCSGPGPAKCVECAGATYGRPKAVAAVAGVLGGRRFLRSGLGGLHYNSRHVRDVMHALLLGRRGPRLPETVAHTFRDDAKDGPADAAVLGRLPAEPFILFVGALRRVKGVFDLLEAYAALESPPPLVLIGTPEIDSPAEFPPGTTVIESASHGTVMAAWDRALLGVFPSRWAEPFGNVVHEAMSRGRAVIGTTPGGHADMIEDGVSGLLVPGGDVAALTGALGRLVEDPALRERMGAAALARSREFTAERVMPRFEALYAEVLGRR